VPEVQFVEELAAEGEEPVATVRELSPIERFRQTHQDRIPPGVWA
jgi:hypothetical protein